jgi:hypothetical protein
VSARRPIIQSSTVTPGHVGVWTTDGVLQDGGPATEGAASGFGITANGGISFAISSANPPNPYVQYGISVNANGTITIYMEGFGGAPAATLFYNINGITYPFNPSGNGNITGPTVAVSGDLVSFNGVGGNLVEDSGIPASTITTNQAKLFPPIANIAALEAATSTTLPQTQCYVLGYYNGADGGEDPFIVGTTTTANGGTIVNDASGRSWYRLGITNAVSVLQFGAKGDGVTLDTAAFNAATAWMHSLGGGTVLVPVKAFLIDPIVMPANVTLQGTEQGPFEGIANPATTVIAPTLIPNSTGSAFVSLTGFGSSISDILIYYPQQVAPTAATPNAYPATISVPSGVGAANNIRRLTLVNSYIGINISNGRVIVEDCKIGAYLQAIIIDPAEDWVILSNIMIQVFYNTFLGLSYPQAIDTWVMNHGIGVQIGRADSVNGSSINMFGKFTGFELTDGTHGGISPQYGWGRFVNTDFDTVSFGISCKSSNAFAQGYQFVNPHFTANSGVGTTGQQWLVLTTGGSGTPVVGITGGGIDGTWVGGQGGFLNSAGGTASVVNLLGYNPIGDEGPPAFPATTIELVNPFPTPVTIYISGGTISTVAINGTNTLNTAGPFRLGVGSNIAIAYTGSPSWVWFGD